MKTIAFITEKNETAAAQWQFDKVMAAIAYDLDLTLIFVNDGIKQLQLNPAWKCLNIYGVNNIYYVSDDTPGIKHNLIAVKELKVPELKQLMSESQLLL